ncbi:MAG TPA: ABC transporter permease [Opitutaceae bacterium]|nr:ABC transporter permease [Opitutaceae bacterium]
MTSRATPTIASALMLEPARMVAGLWHRRELIWEFTHRAIELRHKGSRLGAFWALLNPLSMLALYFVVFGVIYNTRFRNESVFDFSLALFLGLSLFHAFSETLSLAPTLITGNPNFVKKVVFPLEVLPVAQIGAATFHLTVSLGLVLIGCVFSTAGLSWHVLWLPVLILPLLALSLGLAWFLAAFGVFVRDIGQVIPFAVTALMFASAVMYPPSRIPPAMHWLRFNPLLQIGDLARQAVFWHEAPALHWLAFVYVCAIVVFTGGAVFFVLLRKSFAEVI